MTSINNAQDLLDVFGMPANPYFDPVALNDTRAGFSIKRHYPTDIRFKPALRSNGEPDDVVVIWITYRHNRLNAVTGNVPVLVRFAKMSEYLAGHFEYDYTDPRSPTKESVEVRDGCPQPLGGSLNDEFVFSTSRGVLETVEGVQVSGAQILDRAFAYHCDSVHPIRGLRARSEVAWVDGVHNGLNWIESALAWVLKHVFGRQRVQPDSPSILPKSFALTEYERVPEDNIEIAGYKASKRIVLVFAILAALLSYWLLPAEKGSYLEVLAGSEFLLLIHALILLVALDEGVPRLLFGAVNLVLKVRRWYFFKSWK